MIRPIGAGAYGVVWLARNIFGTLRAAKIVYRRSFSEVYPFEREFRGIQKYEPVSRTHEGLVNILQIGRNEEAGCFYYVMELADASPGPDAPGCGLQAAAEASARYAPRTLRGDLKRRGRLPPSECLELALKLTGALHHLHQAGLVHRDIKPSNIIFVGDAPKLADIGLVAEMDEAHSFVGTMGFIPPEGPGRPQADIYGLGKVLYEMLSGKDRNEFPALPDQFLTHRGDASPSETEEEVRLVSNLNQVVLRACESRIRLRYASARAMLDDLALLQSGGGLKRRPLLQQLWSGGKQVRVALTQLVKRRRPPEAQSTVAEANHLFEKGHLCALGATPERLRQAARYFSEAIDLDPQFVPAQIGLVRVHLLELTALPKAPPDAVREFRGAAEQLMVLARPLAEARMARGLLKYLEGDLVGALAEAEAATRMRSCSRQTQAITHSLAASCLLESGRAEIALKEMKLSERAVPICAIGQVGLGHPYFAQRRFDLAMTQYEHSIELEPRQHLGHLWKGRVYEELGDFPRAIDAFEQADLRTLENDALLNASPPGATEQTRVFYKGLRTVFENEGPSGYWRARLEEARAAQPQDPHAIGTVLARLGRTDEAYEWLERACREGKLRGLAFDHCWDRVDARFRAVAEKVGFCADGTNPPRAERVRDAARLSQRSSRIFSAPTE